MVNNKDEIQLGDKVKDIVTGYEGVVVVKSIFLNGCIQYAVAHSVKKGQPMPLDGAPSIDSISLKIIKKDFLGIRKEEKIKEKKSTGGPTQFIKSLSRGY